MYTRKLETEIVELQKIYGNEFLYNFIKRKVNFLLNSLRNPITMAEVWHEAIELFHNVYLASDKPRFIENQYDIYKAKYRTIKDEDAITTVSCNSQIARIVFLCVGLMAYYERCESKNNEDILQHLRFSHPCASQTYMDEVDEDEWEEKQYPDYIYIYDPLLQIANIPGYTFNSEFEECFIDDLYKAYGGVELTWDTGSTYLPKEEKKHIDDCQFPNIGSNRDNLSQPTKENLLKELFGQFHGRDINKAATALWIVSKCHQLGFNDRMSFLRILFCNKAKSHNSNVGKHLAKFDIENDSTLSAYFYWEWDNNKKNRDRGIINLIENFSKKFSENNYPSVRETQTANNGSRI